MAKKIFVENLPVDKSNKFKVNKEELNKINKSSIYGEIPLKTYELIRNSFIGIK